MGQLWGTIKDKAPVFPNDFDSILLTPCLEQAPRLHVKELNARGVFSGGEFVWRWKCGDTPSGSIRIVSEARLLTLHYLYGNEGEQETIAQKVRVTYTPCNYGGKRPWLLCSRCGQRVGVLAGFDKYFLCRHCYQLPYQTQLMGKADRLQERATKIKERLGIEDARNLGRLVYDFDRPKGMHHTTFRKLQAEANQFLRKSLALWSCKFPMGAEMILGDIFEDLG